MERRAMLQCLLVGVTAPLASGVRADEALWSLLQGGGQVVLLRHALTEPGVGDPPGFRLDDCASQRNLSEQGRRDARRLGEALRARGVPVARLLSSPWCRCLETARLAFGREAEVQPALGNLFGRPEREAQQVAELRRLVRRAERGNLFMVTHGSTTYALTGVSPASGEMVVLTPQPDGGFRVAGRLAP
jgi:phosphohistidine phosphatase SixA